MPVYLVTDPSGATRLVDANTKQTALNHVVGQSYTVEPVTTSELAAYMRAGAQIESAPTKPAKAEEAANGV